LKWTGSPSAKRDVHFPKLQEAMEEGQKTFVFWQFTSFLAIVSIISPLPPLAINWASRPSRFFAARMPTTPESRATILPIRMHGMMLQAARSSNQNTFRFLPKVP
jgi:hypothetical protein